MTIQKMPISNIINTFCPDYCPSQQEENLSKADPETIFTFTDKELDAETGYSYFGARYFDPATLTAWLSVDPMSDKYPSISPLRLLRLEPAEAGGPGGRRIDIER